MTDQAPGPTATYAFRWTKNVPYTIPQLRRGLEQLYANYIEANARLASAATDAHAKRRALRKSLPKLTEAYNTWHPLWELVQIRGHTIFQEQFEEAREEYLELEKKCRHLRKDIPVAEGWEEWSRGEEERRWKVYEEARRDVEALPEWEEEEENPPKPTVRINSLSLFRRPSQKPPFSDLQAWTDYASDCFTDYSSIEHFPSPPAFECGNPLCEIQSRKLAACACNIRWAFRHVHSDLNEEKQWWHPSKFEECEKSEEYMRKAEEIYVVLDNMASSQEARKKGEARNGGGAAKRLREEEGEGVARRARRARLHY